MILKEICKKINPNKQELFWVVKKFIEYRDELVMILIIILSLSSGFGLGRLSKIIDSRPPVSIEFFNSSISETANLLSSTKNKEDVFLEEYFVASKKGSKYYFPWCSGARNIKSDNLIKFMTREEAESAGYGKAVNCPGL